MKRSGPAPHVLVPVPPFSAHFERSAQALRGALTDLFASARVDPAVPQAVARRLGLNKNLAWKICKIVNGADLYQSVQHLPGSAGITILLEAFDRAGADELCVASVRQALDDFDAMIEAHAGDRATLELMLDSTLSERTLSPRLEQARKLAFQGNSAVLGVRARLRAAAAILSVSRLDPEYLEVTILSALVDLKRLRSNVSWPLVRFHASVEGDENGPAVEALDPESRRPGEPPLVRRFCSTPLPEIRAIDPEAANAFELCEGPVGKTAKSTCVFGWHFPRFAPMRAQFEGERGEYFIRVDTPAESLLFDLLVHRDLPFDLPPEADFFSLILGAVKPPLTASRRYLLPRMEGARELGTGARVLATPHHARHPEIVKWACDQTGRALEEYRVFRLAVAYPPIPSLGILHFPLIR